MANATKYVDNVNGNNANTGDSEAQAYANIPTAIAAITGGGNIIYVQAGSNYTLTSTIALTSALKGDITNGRNRIIGYTTTPGADDGRPVITSATNSVALFTLNDNDFWEFKHLNLTHTATTRGNAFTCVTSMSTPLFFTDLIVDGCASMMSGNNFNLIDYIRYCEITNCTGSGFTVPAASATATFYGCHIHHNTSSGIATQANSVTLQVLNSIINNNSIGVNQSQAQNQPVIIRGCTIANNSSHGVATHSGNTANPALEVENSIFYGNGGYGISQGVTQATFDAYSRFMGWNAFGSNTSGAYTGIGVMQNEITLSADPFTNAASNDFSLNNTAGGGAACRAVGFQGVFPGGLTTGYRDIGAAQHQDSGGSSVKGMRILGG